jgi:hypothetical protein
MNPEAMVGEEVETEAAANHQAVILTGSDLRTISLSLLFTLLFSSIFWTLAIRMQGSPLPRQNSIWDQPPANSTGLNG